MKKILFINFSVFLIWNCCPAQYVFQKSLVNPSNQYPRAFDITADGGFIITGNTYGFGAGSSDIFLLKTDSLGTPQWMKAFGGTLFDDAWSVLQASDGGYLITGNLPTGTYLIKTDSNGDTLWTKSYYNPVSSYYARFTQETNDHGFIIACEAATGITPVAILVKTDSVGNIEWAQTISTHPQAVWQTFDGGFMVTGRRYANGFGMEKTNSLGITQWAKVLWNPNMGPHTYDSNTSAITSDSGFVLAGDYHDSLGYGWCYLVKTNASGDTLWTRGYGFNSGVDCVRQTYDGGYILLGWTGQYKILVLKTDSIGTLMWAKINSYPGFTLAKDIYQTDDGGFAIAAEINYLFQNRNVYLIKTDSNGYSGCFDSIVNPVTINSVPPTVTSVPINNSQPYLINFPFVTIVSSVIPQDSLLCISQVGISEQFTGMQKIYPNPFTETLNVSHLKVGEKTSIVIYDLMGEKVFEKEIALNKTEAEFNLSFLQQGVYFLNVKSNGERWTRKIVKM